MNSSHKNTLHSVFHAIRLQKETTRKEIAASLPISLVSVCKAVNVLESYDLVTESDRNSVSVGRHAGVLSVSNRTFMIIDICNREFKLEVIDFNQNSQCHLGHIYNPNAFFEENLYIFATGVKSFYETHAKDNCIGAGILIPGRYSPKDDRVFCSRNDDFKDVKLKDIFEPCFPTVPLTIEEDISMGAAAVMNAIPIEGNAIYLKADHPMGAALMIDGEMYRGIKPGIASIQRLFGGNDTNVNQKKYEELPFITKVRQIAQAINSYLTIFDPQTIIIESEDFYEKSNITGFIEDILIQEHHISPKDIPRILHTKSQGCNSKLGISCTMIDKWMDNFIK